jgi:Domain of unknown function (DUF4868)
VDLLLAIRKDRSIAEVRLERRTKEALSAKYAELRATFLGPATDIHEYVPAFRPEDDGVLKLKFDLPADLWNCRQSLPNGIPGLDGEALGEGIRALIAVNVGKKPSFYFQALDNRFMLRPDRVVFFYDRSFRFNDSTGIVVADRLDAIHEDGFLYFKSEVVVRRFLDIEEFFTEATDSEIQRFFGSSTFAATDMNNLKEMVNTPLRRKLHGIIRSERNIDSKGIQAVAKRVKFAVKVVKDKIVIPVDQKEFRELFRIIDDAYLESMLDRRSVYLTTSKRPV